MFLKELLFIFDAWMLKDKKGISLCSERPEAFYAIAPLIIKALVRKMQYRTGDFTTLDAKQIYTEVNNQVKQFIKNHYNYHLEEEFRRYEKKPEVLRQGEGLKDFVFYFFGGKSSISRWYHDIFS